MARLEVHVDDASDLEALAAYAAENGMTVEDALLTLAAESARDYFDDTDEDEDDDVVDDGDDDEDDPRPSRHNPLGAALARGAMSRGALSRGALRAARFIR